MFKSLLVLLLTAVLGADAIIQVSALHLWSVPLSPTASGDSADWELVFHDEFNGDALNDAHWVTCYWWDNQGCNISGNNELEWYQPDRVQVSEGQLQLEAGRQSVEATNGQTYAYTSGMVTTGRNTSDLSQAPRFTFQYGYAEIRARVPAGQGLWPAFWLLPATHKSKPEIDVMEILGDTPQITRMHVHYWDENGQRANDGQNWVGPDFSAGWHTFSVNWQANMIVWYVDGIERWRLTDVAAISHEPMYLLLNLAVGGDWPGAPDGTTMFPAVYEIDYVRVWQYRPSSARHEIFYCSLHCL